VWVCVGVCECVCWSVSVSVLGCVNVCVSVCWNKSACERVCECVQVSVFGCVSVRCFLLIAFVQWFYCLTAHLVPVIFRNAASCFGIPSLYLGPRKEHPVLSAPGTHSIRYSLHPVLTAPEAGGTPATVSTLE
jgi:hypothetical protein